MKVLVLRFRAIGDCIMAAWPVTSIREKYPEAEIVWATEAVGVPMIDTSRLVNEIVVFPGGRRTEPNRLKALRDRLVAFSKLRGRGFDLGIDFHGQSKTAIALRLAAPKKRVAVQAQDALSARLNPVPLDFPKDRHWVDHHHLVLNTLEPFNRATRPLMPQGTALPEGFPAGNVVSISTGGSHVSKKYPAEQWGRVAADLRAAGMKVVSVGGPGDDNLEGLVDQSYVGKIGLKETFEVIRASALHLSPDTATGHMAAAVGTPVISLFAGSHNIPERFRPYTDLGTVIHHPEAMAGIATEEVVSAALTLLRK